MIVPRHNLLNSKDQEHIKQHHSYLAAVAMNDPQRARLLRDLLNLTYQYESIAAGDILLAVDFELHGIFARTV